MSRLRSSSWLSNYYLGKYGTLHPYTHPYHSYPYAWGGALRILPYLTPVPTLFVAAPSGAYGVGAAELDWTDVRLSGAADEGYLCETAAEAVKVISEFLNVKWAHLPQVQILFSGVASDPDNVWEFKDGSVLPFSQVHPDFPCHRFLQNGQKGFRRMWLPMSRLKVFSSLLHCLPLRRIPEGVSLVGLFQSLFVSVVSWEMP